MSRTRRRWLIGLATLLVAAIAGWSLWGWLLGREYDRRIAALAAAGCPTLPEDLVPVADEPGNRWDLLEEAADLWEATCERKELCWFEGLDFWDDAERDAWHGAWPDFAPVLDLARRAADSRILVAPPFLPGDKASALVVTGNIRNLLDAWSTLRPAERSEAIALLLEIAARIRPHDFPTAAGAGQLSDVALRRARRAVENGWRPSADHSRRLRAALRDLDKPWPEQRRGAELVHAHWIVTEFRAGRDPFAKARATFRMLRDTVEDREPTTVEKINDRLDGPIAGVPSGLYRHWIARPLLYRLGLAELEPIERQLSSGEPSRVATALDGMRKDYLARTRLAEFALAVLENGGTEGIEIPTDPHTYEPFRIEETETGVVLSSTTHVSDEDDTSGECDDLLRWVVPLRRQRSPDRDWLDRFPFCHLDWERQRSTWRATAMRWLDTKPGSTNPDDEVRRQSVAARAVYEALIAAEKEGDFAALVRCVWKLLKEYPKSVFVGPAVLDMAAARPGMPFRQEEYAAWITHLKDAGAGERSLVLVLVSRAMNAVRHPHPAWYSARAPGMFLAVSERTGLESERQWALTWAGIATRAWSPHLEDRLWEIYWTLDRRENADSANALLLEIIGRFPGSHRTAWAWDDLSRSYLGEENYAEALRCLVAWRALEDPDDGARWSEKREALIGFCRAALLGSDERLDTLEEAAFDPQWPVPELSVIYADLMMAQGRKEALIWKTGVALTGPKPPPGARTIEMYLSMIRSAEAGDAKSLGVLIRERVGNRRRDWQEEKALELLGVMANGGDEEARKILDRHREK